MKESKLKLNEAIHFINNVIDFVNTCGNKSSEHISIFIYRELRKIWQDEYVHKKAIQSVIKEIEEEIALRPQYPNIGKKGCVKRLRQLLVKNNG